MDEGVVKFKNLKRKEKVPFVVYADFEALNKKVDSLKGRTRQYQKYRPCGFCFQIVCSFDEKIQFETVLFRATQEDQDVGQMFVKKLEEEIKKLLKRFDFRKKMIVLEKDKKAFEEAICCWICEDEFDSFEKKVQNHCHFTGKFRGAAHSNCNLQFQKPKSTPVFFHNLSGYDAYLFVKNLGKTFVTSGRLPTTKKSTFPLAKKWLLAAISKNKEKEKLVHHEIRFVDSFKFMASTLENLVKNLSPEHFVFTKRAFRGEVA